MHHRFWGYDGENRHKNPCPHGAYILAGGAFCGKKESFIRKKKKPAFFPSAGLRADCEHIKLERLGLKKGAHSEKNTAERGDGETRSWICKLKMSIISL